MSTRRANHNHTCKANGCTVQVSNKYLMCRSHWATVPQHIKDRVSLEWYNVQVGGLTEAYARAVRDAINAVGGGKRQPHAQSVNDFTEE